MLNQRIPQIFTLILDPWSAWFMEYDKIKWI